MKNYFKLFKHAVLDNENGKIIFKWVYRIFLFSVFVFIILVIGRIFHFFYQEKVNVDIENIKKSKLTLPVVLGDSLPLASNDIGESIKGIDANKNGIRDDVELRIFEKYPDSAKIRAPLLQYAFTLQLENEVKTRDERVVEEVVLRQKKAMTCISEELVPRHIPDEGRNDEEIDRINSYIYFVKDLQHNTEARIQARKNFLSKLKGLINYDPIVCDINSSDLPD
ncbi:MAG: hypothetical protein WCX79_01890 [Candidatus Paceibacterota bacterium]